jgi:hypothetical protein
MKKTQELEILRECAEKLGPNSYCGPWLLDQLPFIERDMRSNMLPQTSWTETRRLEQTTIALAKNADLIRNVLKMELQKAIDAL